MDTTANEVFPIASNVDLPAVLAVDDFNLSLLTIKSTLKDIVNLYTVQSAENALAVLNLVPVKLILLDLAMPDMDGFQFLEQLRSIPGYSKMPVIIVTSNAKQETLEKILLFGITDYVVKPFNTEALREKVIKALGLECNA